MQILGIIPARGGSQGLPGKNLKRLGSRSLIGHAVASAKESKLLTRFIVSTDDKKIAREAKKHGADVPFLRPTHLASGRAAMVPVLQHAVQWLKKQEGFWPDIVVLLQPVCPFRRGQHIDQTIQKLIKTGADSVLTVREPDYSPYFMKTMIKGDKVKPIFPKESKTITRRQDAPVAYRPTGSVYATNTNILMDENRLLGDDTRGLIMPFEVSINIDSMWDFLMAETLVKNRLVRLPAHG